MARNKYPEETIARILAAAQHLFLEKGYEHTTIQDIVSELGDVELEVCVSGGYVSAVLFEDRVNGSDLRLALYLGGGQEYVDDIGLELEVDGDTIEVASSGDHGLKSGVFTDETTVRIREGGSTLARVSSEMSIDPKAGSDNFQWKLGVDSSGLSIFVLDIKGDLTLEKDCISLDSEEVSVRAVGMEVCQLALSYYVDCHPVSEPVSNPRLVTQMDEEELMAMVLDTQERVMVWGNEMEQLFLTRLPQELLWDLMSVY